jgi:predicted MPP superfamily phosphohydrolase
MIQRMTIPLPRLPAAFDGLTVGVVADLHAGGTSVDTAFVRKVVDLVNGERPDMVVLPGDTVHETRRAPEYLPLLAELKAPMGVWACLGNHEHGFVWISKYIGARPVYSHDEWRAMYAEAGIGLLVNEARPLERDDSRIWIVGVDDAYSRSADLGTALKGVSGDEFRLGVTHSPDLIDDPQAGSLDLIVAGHTHGGQVSLPLIGPLWAPCNKFRQRAAGLVRENGTVMYVTRGIAEGLPIRFGCPREIPIITLRRGVPATRS